MMAYAESRKSSLTTTLVAENIITQKNNMSEHGKSDEKDDYEGDVKVLFTFYYSS